MNNEGSKHVFDLEERTSRFGIDVLSLCGKIKVTIITEPLIKQIVRSATSIGANYMEANGASSKRDFCNKIYICKKESLETKHWLKMMLSVLDTNLPEMKRLYQEAHELSCIFNKISSSAK